LPQHIGVGHAAEAVFDEAPDGCCDGGGDDDDDDGYEQQRQVGDDSVQETADGVAAEYAECHV
jgi:hypothetical protein